MAWLARPGGDVVIGHGPFTAVAEPPAKGTAFYVRSFGPGTSRPWLIQDRTEISTLTEFSSRFADRAPPHCEWHPLDAGPFSTVFQEVSAAIRGGLFEKTVPVVAERGFGGNHIGRSLIAPMTRQNRSLRSYGFFDGQRGFAGATPELLFSLSGTALETMALAGTAKREDREVFAVDEKEIREHEYVAQTLVSKLQSLGNPVRKSREILDLGSIVHFLSLIQVELEQRRSPEDLIELLHPTPALGPLPRTKETLSLLLAWRERLGCPEEFGAPFGVHENDRFDAVVAIRGIWWNENEVILPAGCGVIEASRLVNEWRELRLKREAVKQLISP